MNPTMPSNASAPPQITLPDIPVLAMGGAGRAALLTTDGEIKTLPLDTIKALIHKKPVLCCYAPYIRARLGKDVDFYPVDVLELFAFVHPATFAIPTPNGLCEILTLDKPADLEDTPIALMEIAKTLLAHLQYDELEAKAPPAEIAAVMGLQGKGWPWTPYILEALGQTYDPAIPVHSKTALNIWKHLPEWEESAPRPPPHHYPLEDHEVGTRLTDLVHNSDRNIEPRPQQQDYAKQIAAAFNTPQQSGEPHIVLAEAGTGTGKTLGYLAPASLWSEKNGAPVWISTYTKNLQRQIAKELDRLYPVQAEKEKHIAIRKGRENYLCLLNLEDAAAAATTTYTPQHAVAAGIMARWAAATKDGDLSGADFPGWLTGLLGYAGTLGLADRRGECIYSACDHYKKCFSEQSIRKAKDAQIVVANHALVMIQSAMAGANDALPARYIFDEGHHLFDAADSAFAAHLTAIETRDLRNWILGNEGGKAGRTRGLKRRAGDLCAGNSDHEKMLQDILDAASQLTAQNWSRRFKNAAPQGPAEEFLYAVMQQVNARSPDTNTPYSIETPVHPVEMDIQIKAIKFRDILTHIHKPMEILAAAFMKLIQNDEGLLDSDSRKRLESVSKALIYRAQTLLAWIDILNSLKSTASHPQFIDWMEITRIEGQAVDVGIFRHWVDPMKPFSTVILPHLDGMAITSATLRDTEGEQGWSNAMTLTGAKHLASDSAAFSIASPFDYAKQTRIYVIDDVNKNDVKQVANAFRQLFLASNGGALGLFTAINRLRQVHQHINASLDEAGIPLYAQHIDDIDTGTLIDMFRYDINACLLGTDATRDGIDIPGDSLRLLAFDRMPWPRPTLLHKARRAQFGERAYDEMITRLKLKQAFGRLIRSADDKGVFVMLDSGLPTRLQNAFPESVTINKCGLSKACEGIKDFLDPENEYSM
jgi:ATP-dependent DNA helicase DinG